MQYRAILLFLAAAALVCCGRGGTDPIDQITIPEGFEIELAAGPPLVERPMIVDMDDQGRLYVAESSGSNDPVQQQLAERPHSILRLEDTDGDGRYDTRTVFADKMMLPEGVLWHDGSVYVTAPPSIWKLTDTDGDGVADERVEWFDAKTLTNCANDLHGPYLGLDGRIYWTKGAFAEQTYERPGREPLVTRAAHIFRRRVEGGPVEHVLTGGMDNPVEVAFTPQGERLLTSTFLIHPQLGKRDGVLHAVYGGVYGKANGVTDSHPMTGGYLSIMTHMGGAATVGLERYESGVFGEDYRGRLFVTSFNLRKVSSHRLVPHGATFKTEDADFLVSESRDFHPTDVMEDADGSLLVVDTGAWYKLCCPTAQLPKPDLLGAIYRIRKKGAVPPEDPLGQSLDWQTATPGSLARLLDDPRPAVRRRALAALATDEAVGALEDALAGSPSADVRRNAVWALTRIETDKARSAVRTALSDEQAGVRQAALHSVALHRDGKAVAEAVQLLRDPSDAVKRVAAEALGRIADPAAVGPLLDATALTEGEVLTHSLIYALIEIADARGTRPGLQSSSARTQRAAMIALDQMRPAALGPGQVLSRLDSESEPVASAARWIASRHPEWGGHLAGYLGRLIGGLKRSNAEEVQQQLGRFSSNEAVQELLARTVRGSASEIAKTTVLEAMAAAPVEAVPEGWADAISHALEGEPTRDAALRAARSLPRPEQGLPGLDRALLGVARDESIEPRLRVQALDAGRAALDALDARLFEVARSQVLPDQPVDSRAAAARVLATVPLTDDQLTELANLLPEIGPMELPRIVEAFGQSQDSELGSRLLNGLSQANGLANLRADILRTAVEGYQPEVRAAIDALIEGGVSGLEEQHAKLDGLLAELPQGDVVRGQAVFNSSETACLSCHTIGYDGGRIGPDLTRIGEIRERRDLLEAIVFPSSSFVRSYEPIVAVTNGESINGVPIEESETHLLLAVSADEQVRIPRASVEEVRPGTVSVMPAGLDDQLSTGQLADLLAFLEATQWGPNRSRP